MLGVDIDVQENLGYYIQMPANHNIPHTETTKLKMSLAHKGIPLLYKRRLSKMVDGVLVYQCGICKDFYPAEGFYKNKRTILGLTYECRTCHGRVVVDSRNKETSNKRQVVYEANRRARKNATKGRIGKQDIEALEKLFGAVCLKCGDAEQLQWDHVMPLSCGGEHCISNLQRLCRKCNAKKHTGFVDYRSPEQELWVLEFKRIKL